MPAGSLNFLLRNMSTPFLCPFLIELLVLIGLLLVLGGFDIELYELFIYVGYLPLISHIISKNFSHSVGCLFVLSMISFYCTKAFKFN